MHLDLEFFEGKHYSIHQFFIHKMEFYNHNISNRLREKLFGNITAYNPILSLSYSIHESLKIY